MRNTTHHVLNMRNTLMPQSPMEILHGNLYMPLPVSFDLMMRASRFDARSASFDKVTVMIISVLT